MTIEHHGHVSVERRTDGIAVVRLDHRGSRMNTISLEVVDGIAAAAHDLTRSPAKAVVLTGNDRLFSAGAEISEFDPRHARALGCRFQEAFDAFAAIPRVTIAAVRRYALGAACELIQTCDLRLLADNARVGQPEILLGAIPGAGGTQRLTRLVGLAHAKDLVLSGRQITAADAYRIGLANELVAEDELENRALELAAEFAAGAVLAHAIAKRVLERGLDVPLVDALELENQGWADAFATEDAEIGVRSFFANGPGHAEFVAR
ncbi:MAG: enoyl-CoA hydratase/isomerase family protein [Pseudonocardia sp.]